MINHHLPLIIPYNNTIPDTNKSNPVKARGTKMGLRTIHQDQSTVFVNLSAMNNIANMSKSVGRDCLIMYSFCSDIMPPGDINNLIYMFVNGFFMIFSSSANLLYFRNTVSAQSVQ